MHKHFDFKTKTFTLSYFVYFLKFNKSLDKLIK
jgi:hypothetical protein